jgi:predicted nucleic acid-binding protein
VKLIIEEAGTRDARLATSESPTVATSTVSYVETRAALARMKAGRRIGDRDWEGARRYLDHIWLDVLSVPVEDEVLVTAAELADRHSLRGYDAIQLASAVSLRRAGEVRFLCWDAELDSAARAAGLSPLDRQG